MLSRIYDLFESLSEDELILMFYKSGREGSIRPGDILTPIGYFLKIERDLKYIGRRVLIIDIREIEGLYLTKE